MSGVNKPYYIDTFNPTIDPNTLLTQPRKKKCQLSKKIILLGLGGILISV
tara:strand:- start:1022 stop:1171 length:150 start_codon:yes stop_codon:yes gene_type:complete